MDRAQDNSQVKGTILIVDDTPDNLRLLSSLLQSHGYSVRQAINGNLALQAAQLNPPDLILLDIHLPQSNGYQICEQLKANPRTRDVPVIFLSALDQAIDKVKAFEAGGVDYITKPFQIEEVLARVSHQLTIRSLYQTLQQQATALTQQNSQLQAEIKERQRAEIEIRLLLATTQAIHRAKDFQAAIEVILRLVCMTIGWDYGEAWIPDAHQSYLELGCSWYGSYGRLEAFHNHSVSLTFAPHQGLPGRVWMSHTPEWIEDLSQHQEPENWSVILAQKVGLKAVFGIPILIQGQVLAILVFFKRKATAYQTRLVELVNAVAAQLGALIQRKQTEEALKRAEQRYQSIVENAVEGIYQCSLEGEFISANLALAKIYGYESAQALMAAVRDISQQLYVNLESWKELIERLTTQHRVMNYESLVYRQDGSKIWISENVRAVLDETKKILYLEGTVSDITERRLAQEALASQIKQTEQLLLNILPYPVAQRLKQDKTLVAETFEDVTVMFADIVGFTEFSARMRAEELVQLLNTIFSGFDRLAEKYQLEKIKTIGDAYMVVGGLPMPRFDHAQAIALMALEMQTTLATMNQELNQSLTMRIGIHTGPVVAGVIGLTKFIYDLWGDTVNTASRMEANGIPGEIQVSDTTYEYLKGQFELQERGKIPIKGKGEMTTYLLKGTSSI